MLLFWCPSPPPSTPPSRQCSQTNCPHYRRAFGIAATERVPQVVGCKCLAHSRSLHLPLAFSLNAAFILLTASSHANFPDSPPQIWYISQRPGSTPLENSALVARIVTEHSKSQPFDGAWLADGLREEVAGEFSVRHVSPMVIVFLLASASAQLEYTCRL